MKIICIGRNYAEHARELNNAVPSEPVFFIKPDTAIISNNQPFYYPDFSKSIHHEIELVLKVGRMGKHIEKKFAHKYISEITVGIDFTARDLQQECKEKGLPWEKAKAFDGSAPVGKFLKLTDEYNLDNLSFHLMVNNNLVQKGNTSDMIFSVEDIISYVSRYVTLKTGDLIYTGTPSGVGEVKIGDRLECFLEEEKLLDFEIK